jgi:hypothetical protein
VFVLPERACVFKRERGREWGREREREMGG